MPKNLLTHHSEVFNVATMTLQDENPNIFRLFVQWLYVGDVGDFNINDMEDWLEAWIFGDKTGIIGFRDCAMTRLINHHRGHSLRGSTVATAYRKSVSGSKLRKWALDEFRWQQSVGDLHADVGDWVPVVEIETDFTTDVTRAMIWRDDVWEPSDRLNRYLGQ